MTDTEIRALAGATAFTPDFNISPNKDLGDGVNTNDQPFTGSFPYLAAPARVRHLTVLGQLRT